MKTATATLSQLTINPEINPRGDKGYAGLEGIIAQIREHGAIDHIWVRPAKKKNSFEVIDGSRRFHALQALAKKGEWKKDAKIPVTVFDVDDLGARDLALAANFEREALSPADEAIAFTRLFLSGMKIEAITARYAATERLVKQRIAIGSLPEPILSALRSARIDIGTAQMFTTAKSPDQAVKIFKKLEKGKALRRWDVERELQDGTVPGNDRRCVFVGAETYEAAGGTITRDLFGSSDLWHDARLLDKLFEEKIEATARAFKDEGWSFVEVLRKNAWTVASWGRSTAQERELSKDEAKTLKEMEAQRKTAVSELNALSKKSYDDALSDAEEARHDALNVMISRLEEEIKALQAPVYSERQKQKAGVVICVGDHGGRVEVHLGRIKPGAKKAGADVGTPAKSKGSAAKAPADEGETFTQDVTDLLEQEAQKATKLAMVLHTPALAYRMGLAARICEAIGNGYDSPFDTTHEETEAGEAYEAARKNGFALFGSKKSQLGYMEVVKLLETLEPAAIIQIEAYLAADEFEVTSLKNQDTLAAIALVDPDMTAEGFKPGKEFLEKLNKAQLLAIMSEVSPGETFVTSMKKSELINLAEPAVFLTGWLPAALRTPSYKGPGSNAWLDARDSKLAEQAAGQDTATIQAAE